MKNQAESIPTEIILSALSVAVGSLFAAMSAELGAQILDQAKHEGYDGKAFARNGFAGGAALAAVVVPVLQLLTCGTFFSGRRQSDSNDGLLAAIIPFVVFSTLAGMWGQHIFSDMSNASFSNASSGSNETVTLAKQAAASATGAPFSTIVMACGIACLLMVSLCGASILGDLCKKSNESVPANKSQGSAGGLFGGCCANTAESPANDERVANEIGSQVTNV